MKIISVWQPFASLIVTGCKIFETRSWPAPKSVIGTTIGIASTKSMNVDQQLHCADGFFQECFARTGLGDWMELPRGYLLGTALVDSIELMTEEFMEDVSEEEKAYGNWELGNYAWRLRQPKLLTRPIPIRGKQGLFDWHGDLETQTTEAEDGGREADRLRRPEDALEVRSHLRVV